MNKQLKDWVASTRAWFKTQQTSINSCALNIKHSKEQIALLNKTIKLEQNEMRLKIRHLKTVKTVMDKEIKKSRTKK